MKDNKIYKICRNFKIFISIIFILDLFNQKDPPMFLLTLSEIQACESLKCRIVSSFQPL